MPEEAELVSAATKISVQFYLIPEAVFFCVCVCVKYLLKSYKD